MHTAPSRNTLLWCACLFLVAVSVGIWVWLAQEPRGRNADPIASSKAPSTTPAVPPAIQDALESEGLRETVGTAPIPAAGSTSAETFFGLVQRVGGEPSPRTRVAMYEGCRLVWETQTDAEGYFEVQLTPDRPACVLVHSPGSSALRVDLVAGHATRATARRIVLVKSAAMFVRVYDANLRAMGGLRLQFTTKEVDPKGPNHQMEPRVTGTDGCCLLAGIPPVPLSLDIWGDSEHLRREAGFHLVPGTVGEWESVLEYGARVRGLALDQDGAPVVQAVIRLCARSPLIPDSAEAFYLGTGSGLLMADETVTDEAGGFEFRGVQPGRWLIGTQMGSGPPPPLEARYDPALSNLARSVEVLPTDRELSIELRIHRGLTIEGLVLSPEDVPVAGEVSARSSEQGGRFPATAGDDGRFSIRGLSPGEFVLQAFRQGSAPSPPVRALAGSKDVVLKLTEGAELAGRVTDHGKPCSAELVIWKGIEPEQGWVWHLPATGSFRLPGQQPGELVLVARAPGERIGFVTLSVRSKDRIEGIELAVEPGASLRLRCEKAGAGKTQGHVRIRSGTTVVGWLGLSSVIDAQPITVPTGFLEVSFAPEDGSEVREFVTAVAGAPCEIVFRVP